MINKETIRLISEIDLHKVPVSYLFIQKHASSKIEEHRFFGMRNIKLIKNFSVQNEDAYFTGFHKLISRLEL